MISLDLALRLRAAGVDWSPAAGDRFMVPDRDMDTEVFVISDMVVEVKDVPSGRILAFNGTTEWALDSVDAAQAVWLPREHQLRELLGTTFVSLEVLDELSPGEPSGFAVTVAVDGRQTREIDLDVECAYARAVLALRP